MTQTSKRRLILAAIVLFALIVFGCLFLGHHYGHAPATQSQVDALNDALKNGLITKSQYDSEIKKLKDQPQSQPTPQSLP
jgi:cell division protein FtsB